LTRLKGWHSRGYLPHFDDGESTQSVTFRLFDSLPIERLKEWKAELASLPPDQESAEYRRRVEEYVNRGYGEAWLRRAEVASLVESALLYFDNERYALHAWVVMPNHVHALLTPMDRSLASVLHSWKTFTAREANRIIDRRGTFWQPDYFDTYVRHERQFYASVEYIENNPVAARLCARAQDWPFSSARQRSDEP
jgi:REP element-mobilizing transposase RayT